VAVPDGASALREMSQLFGFTPEFLKLLNAYRSIPDFRSFEVRCVATR